MKFNRFIDPREVRKHPLQSRRAWLSRASMETDMSKMERNTSGLRTVLLDEIDSLRNGETSEGRAHAVARLANAAIATVRLEMDAHEFLAKNLEQPKTINQSVKPLKLVA